MYNIMIDNTKILPLRLNNGFFIQFENYLSKKQMEVHFNNHYLKYIEKINIYIKENIDIYEKSIIDFNNYELNLFEKSYNISNRPMFLKKLSKNSKNITAQNSINQAYFHELFFTSIVDEFKLKKYFNKYFDKIFKNQNIFKDFYNEYMKIGKQHFASGWLCFLYNNDKLTIVDTPDAVIPNGNIIACVDLWEHSYYIDYLSDREKYLDKTFLLLNWENIMNGIIFYKNILKNL